MKRKADELEESFFSAIHYITIPYCRKLRNSKVEFYLKENSYKKKN